MNALKLRIIGFIFCLSVSLMLAGCSSTKLFTSSRPTQIDSAELQLQAPSAGAPIAIISTSMGDIRVVLFPEQAPMAVENFTTLAQQGYFNGTIFHRVERDFAIQGGDATGTGKSGASIWNNAAYPNETSALLRHYSGALATVKDQTFKLAPNRVKPTATDAIVRTLLVSPGKPDMRINYRLKKVKGEWRIIDVDVEGIWIVDNYRTQFASVANQSGIEGLIKTLREKNEQAAQNASK